MALKRPTREEFFEHYGTDPALAFDFVMTVFDALEQMEERIRHLEEHLHLDSHNSHKPPFTDLVKHHYNPARPKSDRSSGAQEGHPGTTLPMSDAPDQIVHRQVTHCPRCHRSLEHVASTTVERHQVYDVPQPRLEVTEYQSEVKDCPFCGASAVTDFPPEAPLSVQYGPTIKATGLYLHYRQLVPVKRTMETLTHLFGASIADGTLFLWAQQLFASLAVPTVTIKGLLQAAPVINCDETGLRCKDKRQWLHSVSTPEMTYYQVDAHRGRAAMDAMGILPAFTGTAVHDSWLSYFSYSQCQHGICNAHTIRELTWAFEEDHQRWAGELKELLTTIHLAVKEARAHLQTALPASQQKDFERHYDRLVALGLADHPANRGSPHKRGRKIQDKTYNLLHRLRQHQREVLAFMYDFRVPFTNNLAERDLRMMKVEQKISGTFRSQWGAEVFCRIRGYLSTAQKNGLTAFTALACALTGNPFTVRGKPLVVSSCAH